MKILVTGGSGQLGQCLQELVKARSKDAIEFVFKSSSMLDITNGKALSEDFNTNQYRYCINCAAYTQVDKAETEIDLARQINSRGAKNLAQACNEVGATLIHISTDFVFSGKVQVPYTENDICHPLSIYGQTKLEGEEAIRVLLPHHVILRTSWLYSEYGNNFMKTMLRLGNERDSLSIINDQKGSPTYAKDLAAAVLHIISLDTVAYGTYHFSNEGITTWYGFAKKIFEVANIDIDLTPIPTSAYPTPAVRPKYSVLDKSKIKNKLGIQPLHWEERLEAAMKAFSSCSF